MDNNFTADDIKEIIRISDLLMRPYALILHPDDAEVIRDGFPEIEKEFVLQVSPYQERGKCILFRRKDIEQIW